MTPKEEALRYLNDRGIAYETASHRPALTIGDCAEAEKLLGAVMPRNIFLCTANRQHFALLICRPQAVFRTSSISKQASLSRLSFAPGEKLKELLGTYAGAVSPLGLIYDKKREVKFLMDKTLIREESLLFHPLDNSCSVKLSMRAFTEDLLRPLGYEITFVNMESN